MLAMGTQQRVGFPDFLDEFAPLLGRDPAGFERGNVDDHLKNFSFLMGAGGIWRLSPAYDLTPSDGPRIGNENQEKKAQCTSVAGTFSPGRSDLLKCAKTMGVDGGAIIDQVRDALSQWSVFASDAGLKESVAAKLGADFGAG